ncbi:hypothetical protein N431DRAFT_457655 [Stipitochalara longipes BDJ]|nr:hypothetical protein N431DRAFT_457655 [Stipitochalara longipes BDJ]
MTFHDLHSPIPGSPPDLTSSKSSKSSSFHSSYQSDDNTVLSDVGNFEEIGLDDESRAEAEIGDFAVKTTINPYDATFANDLRTSAKQRKRVPMAATHGNRVQRELTAGKPRPAFPSLRGQVKSATTDGLGLQPIHNGMPRRGFSSPNTSSFPVMKRNRSSSPNISMNPRYNLSTSSLKTRRGSWQSNRERKSAKELEKECDEDDGDDVPDECFLENVPISPRPPQERTVSMPPSTSTSPERPQKDKIKGLGNGTSPKPAEQGELRSPKSPRSGIQRGASMGQFPINHDGFTKVRAKSWTVALSELSEEAKALTEALEAHADTEEKNSDPRQRRSFNNTNRPTIDKPRVKSAIAELPPLRRTDIMIDPLPISKEKEAVLSRTRPSWLPPKDPAEEKRHLKEYQRMMAQAAEAEKRKEAERNAKTACRDDTASSLLRIWEEHVLPNWDETTRQKRTRELWWRGIAPRSRGDVWAKAIGNELGLSDASYTAALRRAQALETTIKRGSQLSADEEMKKKWLDRIEHDVRKTYPELKIFQPDGPLHSSLLNVLKAYAMYRSDVGYVHGTSTIAALLLLNLPTSSAAFCALSNILNRPLPLSFHTGDPGATSRAYSLLLSTLKLKSPRLHAHLTSPQLNLNHDVYLKDVFTSLFTESLSLDNATRLWDVMVFEGDALLVRAGVAYLTAIEGKLFGAESAQQVHDIVKQGLDNFGEEQWMKAVRDAGKS